METAKEHQVVLRVMRLTKPSFLSPATNTNEDIDYVKEVRLTNPLAGAKKMPLFDSQFMFEKCPTSD